MASFSVANVTCHVVLEFVFWEDSEFSVAAALVLSSPLVIVVEDRGLADLGMTESVVNADMTTSVATSFGRLETISVVRDELDEEDVATVPVLPVVPELAFTFEFVFALASSFPEEPLDSGDEVRTEERGGAEAALICCCIENCERGGIFCC